jgi:hypothetical protein
MEDKIIYVIVNGETICKTGKGVMAYDNTHSAKKGLGYERHYCPKSEEGQYKIVPFIPACNRLMSEEYREYCLEMNHIFATALQELIRNSSQDEFCVPNGSVYSMQKVLDQILDNEIMYIPKGWCGFDAKG